MKKAFFSLMAVGMMFVMASCSDENYAPEAPAPGQNTVAADFPEGSEVVTLKVNVPEAIRTRADEMDLPAWDLASGPAGGQLHLRYAVYKDDGSLYYTPFPVAQIPAILFAGNQTTLSVPLPADATGYKLFLWVDKDATYTIDWDNKSIAFPNMSNSGAWNELNRRRDAFYYWGTIDSGASNDYTLKRPFVQVNILTSEFDDQSQLASLYTDGPASSFGLTNSGNPDKTYVPSKWNWDTNEILEWQDYFFTCNISSTYGASLYSLKDVVLGTVNGRRSLYFGVFYLFAPNERGYFTLADGTVLDGFKMNLGHGSTYPAFSENGVISINGHLPEIKQNDRVVISNDTDNDTGFLSNRAEVVVKVDDSFETETSVIP